ncbi:translation initiation factor IF-3 [Helicobacter cholecystus]|uniref:Translation initiation factor IF-3 n=1 Tax=Helicobacter cholecystus TaxID=45498 RepID=A0A3D8IWQ7_9HELI|nr:translation initiation factor IF-3 [Helicobacter cholecystus]RDU69698.1 translation initiation factor IF-3 [Helicobacter cholecystus]VEJ24264.1 translation initiation factor IF-3 [Helicobacter cholecystus]
MSKEETLLNEDIQLKEVRCIGEGGEQFGIMSSREALELAVEHDLDLVLISPNANPPVCKIMDYGKFKYQVEKKQKEAKKKQKQIEIKEIKLSVQIAQNDINYKVKHAREFLENGKHVRFRVFLKQREVGIPGVGLDLLGKISEMLEDIAIAEKEAKLEGRYVNILFVPKKK